MEKTKSLEVPKEIQYLTTKVDNSFVDFGKCCFKFGSPRHIGTHRRSPQVAVNTEYKQRVAMASFWRTYIPLCTLHNALHSAHPPSFHYIYHHHVYLSDHHVQSYKL